MTQPADRAAWTETIEVSPARVHEVDMAPLLRLITRWVEMAQDISTCSLLRRGADNKRRTFEVKRKKRRREEKN